MKPPGGTATFPNAKSVLKSNRSKLPENEHARQRESPAQPKSYLSKLFYLPANAVYSITWHETELR